MSIPYPLPETVPTNEELRALAWKVMNGNSWDIETLANVLSVEEDTFRKWVNRYKTRFGRPAGSSLTKHVHSRYGLWVLLTLYIGENDADKRKQG